MNADEAIEIIEGIESEGGYWHFKPNATATGYELISQTVQVNGTLWNTLAATISPAAYRAVINKRANNDKR